MLPVITVGEGIELKRINPIYSIDLKEAFRIKVFFDAGMADCEANYIELIENPENVVLELYWAEENPVKVTTLSFSEIKAIKLSISQLKTLLITIIQNTKVENPI